MTDLEITRLCAEAMQLDYYPEHGTVMFRNGTKYNPLHDKAQCFELIERFRINISPSIYVKQLYAVTISAHGSDLVSATFFDTDLASAVCLCVAKMQKAKGARSPASASCR